MMMEKINSYVLLSSKKWNVNLKENLEGLFPNYDWILISDKENFTLENLNRIKPKYVFIPHWSFIIPEEIFLKYNCIVFHMTDLPFGRGGSPLQNLIVRGFKDTKVSAIKVEKGLDTGAVFLKEKLMLHGTAEEIFIRLNDLVVGMIIKIINEELVPVEQKGEVTIFKRRKPEMSNIKDVKSINSLYDYIRMMDAEGYPKSFLENDVFRFEFSRASLKSGDTIIADVKIILK